MAEDSELNGRTKIKPSKHQEGGGGCLSADQVNPAANNLRAAECEVFISCPLLACWFVGAAAAVCADVLTVCDEKLTVQVVLLCFVKENCTNDNLVDNFQLNPGCSSALSLPYKGC